ncbi:MAG: 4Fe-4S binding protein [Deltaproteobacteria bacterium]|nr:4Fe-4S binding protein [Deltaproteobacteria bacterium]
MASKNFSDLKKNIIDKGLCTSCGTCVGVCPVGCIHFDYDQEEPVLEDSCTSCGVCFQVCPGGEIPLLEME